MEKSMIRDDLPIKHGEFPEPLIFGFPFQHGFIQQNGSCLPGHFMNMSW